MADRLVPVRLRAAPAPVARERWQPSELPRRVQVLRTHAGPDGRLVRAVRFAVEDGYLAEIDVTGPDFGPVAAWASRQALPGFPGQVVRPVVLSPEQFGKRLLRAWARKGASPVVYEALAAFGPLVQHVRPSRRGGLSCDLVGGGAPSRKRPGRWADNFERPRVLVGHKGDGIGAFVSLQPVATPKGKRAPRWHAVPVVDLAVTARALGADDQRSSTAGPWDVAAADACAAFGVTWPSLAGPLDQLLGEVLALHDLYRAVVADLAEVAPGLAPRECWSAGSVATAALRRAGMADPGLSTAGLPGWVLGACASALQGGEAEALLVGMPVPLALADLNATYPALFSLLTLTPHLAAEHFEHEDVAAAEVQRLFAPVGLRERVGDRAWWASIGALFVEVEPRGEELPVVAKPGSRYRSLVAPFDFGGGTTWVHAADLVRPALAGKLPRILRAFRIVPVGTAPGLQPVRLMSGATCDLTHEDYGQALVSEREAAKALPDPVVAARRTALAKAASTSGSWGVFARCDQPTFHAEHKWSAYSPDGRVFSGVAKRVEVPGPITSWHLGAAIPAACRAVLAMARHDIEAAGGSVAATLTDAIAVPAAPEASLVACPGGPHRLPDGTEAVRLLSLDELRVVLGRFDALLRPQGGPAWKEVAGSLSAPTYGYVVGVNKVLLAQEHEGALSLVRSCDFGLGDHFLDPTGAGDHTSDGHLAWCAALEEAFMRAVIAGRDAEFPAWAFNPAVRHGRGSVWKSLAKLRAAVGQPNLPPFTAFGEVDGAVVLGTAHDPSAWRSWPWVRDGQPVALLAASDLDEDGVPDRGLPALVLPSSVTIAGVFARWQRESDPTTCGPERGLRAVAPVRSHPSLARFAGKAPDDEAGHVAAGDPLTYGTAGDAVAGARDLGAAELARRGVPARTARDLMAGRKPRPSTVERLAVAVTEAAPDRLCAACGRPLPPGSRADKRTCSSACKEAVRRGKSRRACEGCGKALPSNSRQGQRFCDEGCRSTWRRARAKAPGVAPNPLPVAAPTAAPEPGVLDDALRMLAQLPGLPAGAQGTLRRSPKFRKALTQALAATGLPPGPLVDRLAAEGPLTGRSPVGILVARLTALGPAVAEEQAHAEATAKDRAMKLARQLAGIVRSGHLDRADALDELRVHVADAELLAPAAVQVLEAAGEEVRV